MATQHTTAPMDLPLRGNTVADMLVNDHGVIKTMLSDLVNASTAKECETIFERLKAVLTVHNATEENLVYPALAVDAGQKAASEKLYHETAAADTLVFEMDGLLKKGDVKKFESKAKTLQAAILEHIDDEESKAIPKLEQHSDSAEMRLLTAAVRKFRGEIHVGSAS